MKKLFIYPLFLLAFMFFFSPSASADLIPSNSHTFSRCVKIVNLNEFPDLVLISYVTGPMVKSPEIKQINNNECLVKGYKFNSLNIYWNTKDKPNSINSKNLLLENIEVAGGYIDQSNPLLKDDVEYSIGGFSGKKLVLYKSKQTLEYSNGDQKKVETFANPLKTIEPDQPSITPSPFTKLEKRGFWQAISCFFKSLFGKTC